MDDIINQGGDSEPSPWPRRLAVIAPLIVVIVGTAVYLSLPRHQHAPAAAQRAPATAATPLAPPGPDGIAGPTLAWDSALVLPSAGTQPAWFEPASGRSAQIGGLPADLSGYQFIRVVGGWAVQASPGSQAGCNDSCAGPPVPVWFLADGARSVTRIGTANLVAPAATAGDAWLTSYPRGADMATGEGTAREVGATGAVTRPVSLPPGYEIGRGTGRGLLLAPVVQQPGAADKLWDPSALQAGRAFDGVLASSPDEIAWTSRCAPKCGVHLLDLATGRDTVIALPAGASAVSGAFSPDGSLLALQMSFGNTGDGGDLAMQLEVAPTATGRLALVPGTWASSDALVGFGWPSGGDRLVAEFNFTTKTQLTSWQPGASRPAVAVVRPGRDQSSLILG